MLRLMEHPLRGADFQELAGAHNSDACGDLHDDGQSAGDENVSEREFALEFLKEEENLRANRNIKRGDGFVGQR